MPRFKAGQSGNPKGRPSGVPTLVTQFRKSIADRVPEVIEAMIKAAINGDTTAANLLLSRVVPTARPESMTALVPAPGKTLAERAEAITTATLSGDIPSSVAADLMAVLQGQARVIEIDEIEQRLAAIEGRLA